MTLPRTRSGRLVILGAALVAAVTAWGASPFPVASTGDIWFQVDQAGFLGEDDQPVEEYYFRITNNQLQFEAADGDTLDGQVFIRLQFRDADDNDLGEAGRRFAFQVSDPEVAASPDYAQLLVFREPLDPRARSVQVTVEDLNARKRGILYMFTGKRKNGQAVGTLAPPPFMGHDFGISDLQFAWEVRREEGGGDFEKQGLNVVPNPSRSYGLLQPRLSAYYEVYDHRSPEPQDRTYLVHHELTGPGGETMVTPPDTVTSNSGEWVKVTTFDVSKLATGNHVLRAVVVHPASGDTVVSERQFSVIWKSQFWEMTEQDLLDEARVLFREDEYNRFKAMTAGDRAQYVDQFWAGQDPSPVSARNELREEFLRRVAYANRQFSDQKKGMLTDRGRIYIRFGEPDEVQREVLPTQADSQLGGQVKGLTEENITGSLLANKDIVDTRPYEIWTYTRQGSPLFPERETTTSVTGLRFVFIDETGTGHYVLRYSSDFIGY